MVKNLWTELTSARSRVRRLAILVAGVWVWVFYVEWTLGESQANHAVEWGFRLTLAVTAVCWRALVDLQDLNEKFKTERRLDVEPYSL